MDQLNKSSERIGIDNRDLELQLVLERTKISEIKPEIEEWKKERDKVIQDRIKANKDKKEKLKAEKAAAKVAY